MQLLMGKVRRGLGDLWQVVVVTVTHLLQRLSPGARPRRSPVPEAAFTEMSSVDVVSFDLYDTLWARQVDDPAAVHTLVRLIAQRRGVAVPPAWERIRFEAEATARRRGPGPDIRFDDIYRHAPLDDEARRAISRIELEVERMTLRATLRGSTLFSAARSMGRTVVITSDMYLPKRLIEQCLADHGFDDVASVIVSGEDGVAKRDGSSFTMLRGQFDTDTILHIGDDHVKDVKRAVGRGVTALHLQRPSVALSGRRPHGVVGRRHTEDARTSLQASLMRGLQEAHAEQLVDDSEDEAQWRGVGYDVLGPLLVGFSEYLHGIASARGADRLIFLAREGVVLRRGYGRLLSEQALESSDATVSSRLLGLANLRPGLSGEDMRFLTKSPIALTGEQFVRRVLDDVSADRITAVFHDLRVDPAQRVHGARAERVLRPVFERLSEDLMRRSAAVRAPLVQYLESIELQDSRALVVDSGWVGTAQTVMSDLLGSPVGGVYLGIHATPSSRSRPGMSGWVDGRSGPREAKVARTLYAHIQPLEVLLAQPEIGSVVSVAAEACTEGEVRFQHLDSEFSDRAQHAIRIIQREALAFVEEWKQLTEEYSGVIGPMHRSAALAPTLRLLTRPTPEQYASLGPLGFDGTYGAHPTVLGRWWLPDQVKR